MSMPKGYKYTHPRKKREYRTPYSESLKTKDSFSVPETQLWVNAMYDACSEYCSTHSHSQSTGYRHTIGVFCLQLDRDFDIKSAPLSFFTELYYSTPGAKTYIVPFTSDMIRCHLLLNNQYLWNIDAKNIGDMVLPYFDSIENKAYGLFPLFTGEVDYHKATPILIRQPGKKEQSFFLFKFDTDNQFIQKLLLEFLQFQHNGELPRTYPLLFFTEFSESLNHDLPDSIYGFNIETMIKQLTYFIAKRREAEYETRCFYRFILGKQSPEKRSITQSDGVCITYLISERFTEMYTNGYLYIPMNPNEAVPQADKWAVLPNGLDQQTAADKPNDLYFLDFTRITNTQIRLAAKKWFWSESSTGFQNRVREIYYIEDFFEYRDNLRSMYFDRIIQARTDTKLDLNNTVLAEEIIAYTAEWDTKVASTSYAARILPLRAFLDYMNQTGLYKTEMSAFEYLSPVNHGTRKRMEANPVPPEDFQKLISILEENSKHSNLHLLYYIVFCLNTLTPLRISSILDLDVDCVIEKSVGIYAIRVQVKTSDGDKRDIQISKQVKRLIDVAISITSEARMNAPEQYQHYLFLVNNQKDLYKAIPHRSYGTYLSRCCKEHGLPVYSPKHLRKTYYTNLVENAIRENVSLMSLKELTGHSSPSTTEKYYVKENLRNYLEATTGVEIGNMPIAGDVVCSYPEAADEDLVNDCCGYCRNPECNVLGTANCLMCKGFVTTPSHIPQFEEAVATLSAQIEQNPNEHDKEHLYAVKRLYVAYLEQLFLKKEELDNGSHAN